MCSHLASGVLMFLPDGLVSCDSCRMTEEPAARPGAPDWDVANRMRKALRHADIGVAEMADYLGVSRTSVSNWINGRIEPSLQTLRLWSIRTDTDLVWLLDRVPVTAGGAGPPPTIKPKKRKTHTPNTPPPLIPMPSSPFKKKKK